MKIKQNGQVRLLRVVVAAVISFVLVFVSVPAGAALGQVADGSDSVVGKNIGAAIGDMADGASVYAAMNTIKIKFNANNGKVTKKSI